MTVDQRAGVAGARWRGNRRAGRGRRAASRSAPSVRCRRWRRCLRRHPLHRPAAVRRCGRAPGVHRPVAPRAARRDTGSIFAPSRSLSTPSITTRSPGASPLSIDGGLALDRAELHHPHGHRVVVVDDIDEGARRAALDRGARCHGRRAFSVSSCRRTLTNWFGKSAWLSLANSALSLIVPVVGSIWLSTVTSLPSQAGSCRRGRTRRRPPSRPTARAASRAAGVLGDREQHADRLHLRDHDDAVRVGLRAPCCRRRPGASPMRPRRAR